MRNLLLTFSFLLLLTTISYSQTDNCGDGAPACDFDAIGDFDGDNTMAMGTTGGDMCNGGTIHNAVWFSFVAGNTEMTVDFILTNCVQGTTGCTGDGVQIGIWSGCPGNGGTCVAGNSDCITADGSLDLTGLEIGGVYNFVLDGCCGSTCTVELDVSADQWVFDVPDVGDIEVESYLDSRSGCDEIAPDVYCPGQEIFFAAIGDNGIINMEDVGAEFEWSIDGPDPGSVSWDAVIESGNGPDVSYGTVGVDGDPGGNIVTMIFDETGVYEICLDEAATFCDASIGGSVCHTITIVNLEEQNFGEFDLCYVAMAIDGDEFSPPIFTDPATGVEYEWNDGDAIGIADILANNGLINVTVGGGCCPIDQVIQINLVGSIEPGVVEIPLYECQLPYTYNVNGESIEIDEIESFIGYEEQLVGASETQDFEGNNCDSLIVINALLIELQDSLIIECIPGGGIQVFADIYRVDGEDFDLVSSNYVWRDSLTNMVVGMGNPVILPQGGYVMEYSGFVEDALTGNETECSGIVGTYDVVGGMSANPVKNPYDAIRCPDELTNIDLGVNAEPGITYTWNIPPGYVANGPTNSNTINISINDYMPTSLLTLSAMGECGDVVEEFPITLAELPVVEANEPEEECTGVEVTLEFTGDQTNVSNYTWDLGAGMVTSGSATGPTVGVTYNMSGSYSYTLTIANADGCEAMETYSITINEGLSAPEVMCDNDNSSSTQIVFTWNEVTGATDYNVDDISLPPGATGTLTGTTYTVTGVNAGDSAEIRVNVEGSPCGTPSDTQTCSASDCSPPNPTVGNFEDLEFCQGDPNNTTVQFTAQAPAGFSTTYSGNGVTADGLFDPESADVIIGANNLSFIYVDDMDPNCFRTLTATMTIGQLPSADFTISSMDVCQGEAFTISGPAAGPNPVWDFGNGTGDVNGLTFNNAGSETIAVTVTDASGCSDEQSLTFDVIEALEPIMVSCTASTTEVTFTWNEVTGATNYIIDYTDQNGNFSNTTQMTNETSFVATGLMENDMVSITVTAVHPNPNCNNVTSSAFCTAISCETPDIVFSAPETNFCSNNITGAVNLDVLVDGVPPAAGTSTFSGMGVTQIGDMAIFDPAAVSDGTFTAIYDYTSPVDGCVTQAELDFTVNLVPIPELTPDKILVCAGEIVSIEHTGLPTPPIITEWNTSGADIDNLTATTRELAWNNAGIYTVSLTYTVAGCTPETDEIMIEVTPASTDPVILCSDSGTDFILFGWNDQTNFMYEVFIDDVSQGIQSVSEFRVENLNTGQEVEIRVVVIDPVCGDKQSTALCTASPCNVVWQSAVFDTEYCYSQGDPAIEFSITGFDPFESTIIIDAEWQNPEFNGNLFTPNPGSAEYTLVARYTNGNCTKDTMLTINVYENPEFSLTSDSPAICVGTSAIISYDYDITGSELLIWDFGDGVEGIAGQGTQEVVFNTEGDQTVTLQIDNNGCLSDVIPVSIVVEPELGMPVIQCGTSSITTVEVVWDAVDCADSYIVTVDGEEFPEQSELTFTVEDLVSEQTVDITVLALSDCECGDVMADFTCTSDPCPNEDFTFSRDATQSICIDENAVPFSITATPMTLAGTGLGTWSVDGSVNDFLTADGTIDPSLAIAGTYNLTYNYFEGCTYMPMTTITFVDPPSVNLLSATDPACPNDTDGVIEVEALNGVAPYTYTIDGGGSQDSGTFNGVSIGSHLIQATDSNGCVSSVAMVDIMSPTTPTALITGNSVIILDNDGTYDLNFNNTLDPSDIDNIVWFNNGVPVCDSPTCLSYTYPSATEDAELQAVITYSGGCEIMTDIFLVDVKQIQAFYIPDVISPDLSTSDENSQWKMFIKGDEVFPKTMNVYNRWGNLVFDIDWNFDANNPPPVGNGGLALWDGLYGENGPAIVSEVYVYTIQIEVEGILRTVAGDITILR